MYLLLYNNDDFIVVNKPISVSVHCDDNVPGFAALLSQQLGIKLFVVHRLDRVTSGLMILAKSSQAAAAFGELFAHHQIGKYYLAISDTKPRKKQGTIKGDMKKSRRSAWKLLNSTHNPAVTRFFSKSFARRRIFLLKPETGKTHQLRVALKSIGAAITGDPIYSAALNRSENDQPEQDGELNKNIVDRCYLHAWQLIFDFNGQSYAFRQDPVQGELFTSPELADILAQWSEPDTLKWSKKS